MKKLLLAAALAVASLAVYAAGTSYGTVSFIGSSGAYAYVGSNVAISGKPACNTGNRFVWDATTAAGKSSLGIVMLAKASGLAVSFTGTGACTIWGDSEDLDHVYVN